MSRHMALTLTADERTELERRARSRKGRAEDARRARVILMLADGATFTAITTAVGCYPDYVSRWKQRFESQRLAGLQARYRGQRPTVRTPPAFFGMALIASRNTAAEITYPQPARIR
jgi:hypothetical protein